MMMSNTGQGNDNNSTGIEEEKKDEVELNLVDIRKSNGANDEIKELGQE